MPASTYRILGIDPGTNLLGYAVIEINDKNIHLIDAGVVQMSRLPSHKLKLKRIFNRLQEIISRHHPREMAVEAPFYGKNVQSMLKLGRAQGVAIAAGMTLGVDITEYSPKKIKQAITGNGNATKEQVAAMLQSMLKGKPELESLDASDALATAVCHYFQSQNPVGNQKRYGDWSSFLKENPDRINRDS
ncbi:MAG: crossover junction endodeoxyribonuclease RuvC [Saprospiraceae bacterium]|nr:crossover junction endodeoxyribonuclease RuvC [Saprospiraceae bacterium]